MFSLGVYTDSPNKSNSIRYFYASPSFSPWKEYYHREGYFAVDPWLKRAYEECVPIYWKHTVKGFKGRRRQFHEDAISYGLNDGMDFPLHGPNNSYASLIICNLQDPTHRDPTSAYAREIMSYFMFFISRFNETLVFTSKPLESFDFTLREKQCMQLTAEHHTSKVIARKLGISESTVNHHIQKVLKKIGVNSKYQALVLMGLAK